MPTRDDRIRTALLDELIGRVHADVPAEQSVQQRIASVRRRITERLAQEVAVAVEPPVPPAVVRRPSFVRRHAVKFSLAAAAAIVVALISTLSFDGQPTPGMAWAEVLEQIRNAQSARLEMTVRKDPARAEPDRVQTILMKVPDMMRTEQVKPFRMTTIHNGAEMMLVVPDQKQCRRQPADPIPVQGAIGQLLGIVAMASTQPADRTATIEDQSVPLVFQATQMRDGVRLHKFLMKIPTGFQSPSEQETKYAWFDADSGKLAWLTSERDIDGQSVEVATIKVALDIDLPDELFSTDVPAGYEEVTGREKPGDGSSSGGGQANWVPPFDTYVQVCERIEHYRLAVWLERDGTAVPIGRSVRDGPHFRADYIFLQVPDVRATRRYEQQTAEVDFDRKRPWTDPAALEAVWELTGWDLIRATTLDLDGKPASFQSLARFAGQGGSGPQASYGVDPNAARYLLSSLGWPLHFEGKDVAIEGVPMHRYQRLSRRSDRPDLAGVRAEINPASSLYERLDTKHLYVYWLDPARDLLCVRHETYQYAEAPWLNDRNWQPDEPAGPRVPSEPKAEPGKPSPPFQVDTVTEIVAFGQTPDGRWYPTELKRTSHRIVDGKRYGPTQEVRLYAQADFRSPIDPEYFVWPEDVPRPKPGAPFRSAR